MTITVRQIVGTDVAAVAGLSEEGFSESYKFDWELNAKALLDAANAGRAFVAVAEEEGRVIGYCNLRSWPAGGWVDQLAVSKAQQRRGAGRALLEAILKAAKDRGFWKVSLITSEADRGALSFFRECGWEVVGKMRDEIAKGVNGILLSHIVDYELHPNR
jgi:[ribosomal protein S18]-alanine N-acetyltransferase